MSKVGFFKIAIFDLMVCLKLVVRHYKQNYCLHVNYYDQPNFFPNLKKYSSYVQEVNLLKAKFLNYQQLLLYSFNSYFKYIIEEVVLSDYLEVIVTNWKLDYLQPHFAQLNSKEAQVKQIELTLQFMKVREYAKE